MKKIEIQALKDSINKKWILIYKDKPHDTCALCRLHRGGQGMNEDISCKSCIIYKKTEETCCSEFEEYYNWRCGGGKKTALKVIKRLISWLPKSHRQEFSKWINMK